MAKNTIFEVSDETFQALVLDSKVPMFVLFWGEWSGPSHRAFDILEEVTKGYRQQTIRFAKINADINPDTASAYQIKTLPTSIIFKKGSILGKKVGLYSKYQLEDFIDETL